MGQSDLADAIVTFAYGGLWEMTDAHFHHGEYNHVVNLSRIIVQAEPHYYEEAYANCAWLLWSTDRNAQAIEVLKKGITANPSDYYLYDELGMHYLIRLHDPADALPYYEKAVKYKCPFETWHNLAHCYEATNQWTKAVHAWEVATTYPNDALAGPRLARAKAELARRANGH